jgi:hypothetical protein
MSLLTEAAAVSAALAQANRKLSINYPGDAPSRQPIHTVYGGAQLYKAETTKRLGELALSTFDTFAATPDELARAVGLSTSASDAWLIETVHARVKAKLEREAVEDFRIDFEDGFGARSDVEEDAAATRTAGELARAMSLGLTPPFIGIRIKSLSEEWTVRGARTLELFLDTLLAQTNGTLPSNFVITLPKVSIPEQPRALVRFLEILEKRHGLPAGCLRFELMVETPQSLIGPDGSCPLPSLVAAGGGRCVGAHLGSYDLTAACNVTAVHQTMDHPICELAKGLMLMSLAGTGVFLSDGATNVMPVGPHRGAALSPEQIVENRAAVHAAWQLSHRHIRRALVGGLYQGWDLHPAQLPVRYAATYAFFLSGLSHAAERLRTFIDNAAQATLAGGVFDDAATGQGLLNYFLRALACGAIDLADVERTGLTADEVELRSFAKILAARRARLGD